MKKKVQYKIKGKTFISMQEIAKEYLTSLNRVKSWVKNKKTPNGDMVRIIRVELT